MYVLDDGKPKDRKLAFSETSKSVNIYGKTTPYELTGTPTLTGKGLTDVTYAVSANSGIASVDESTGVVTLGGVAGEVTITASAPETDKWLAGEASYKITVVNEVVTAYYKKVVSNDDIVADGTYLIVYETSNKLFKPVLNTNKDGFSTSTDNAIDVTITDGTIACSETVDACQIVLTNQDGTNKKFSLLVRDADGDTDYYLVVYGKENSSASGSSKEFYASPTGTEYRTTFSVESSGLVKITGNSNHYLRYNNNAFSTTTSSSTTLAMYKLVNE